jgi:hypothetical protein
MSTWHSALHCEASARGTCRTYCFYSHVISPDLTDSHPEYRIIALLRNALFYHIANGDRREYICGVSYYFGNNVQVDSMGLRRNTALRAQIGGTTAHLVLVNRRLLEVWLADVNLKFS